jgi:hypothetical protein
VVEAALAAYGRMQAGGMTQQQARALAEHLGVTHLVFGEISPTYNVDPAKASDRLIVDLKIFDTTSSHVVNVPRFEITAGQFEGWQP